MVSTSEHNTYFVHKWTRLGIEYATQKATRKLDKLTRLMIDQSRRYFAGRINIGIFHVKRGRSGAHSRRKLDRAVHHMHSKID